MTDPPEPPSTSAPGPPAGTPRWVKILGVALLLLDLLVVVLHLTGNSLGGPGSHLGAATGTVLP